MNIVRIIYIYMYIYIYINKERERERKRMQSSLETHPRVARKVKDASWQNPSLRLLDQLWVTAVSSPSTSVSSSRLLTIIAALSLLALLLRRELLPDAQTLNLNSSPIAHAAFIEAVVRRSATGSELCSPKARELQQQ